MRYSEIDQLDSVLNDIGNYIWHNIKIDFHRASRVLKEHGYIEHEYHMPVFRYLMHTVSDEERATFKTHGALFDHIKNEIRIDLSHGPQGFTPTLEDSTELACRTQHMYRDTITPHNYNEPLDREIIVIYEIVAPASAILFSAPALKKFLTTCPDGEGKRNCLNSMDPFEGGYNDPEIVIDTTTGCRVTDAHLFDNERLMNDIQ